VKIKCPRNHEHSTSPFSSYQDVWCHECRAFFPWPKDDDQQPLVSTNRDKRRK
jgi:hypothetical protein